MDDTPMCDDSPESRAVSALIGAYNRESNPHKLKTLMSQWGVDTLTVEVKGHTAILRLEDDMVKLDEDTGDKIHPPRNPALSAETIRALAAAIEQLAAQAPTER